MIIEAYPEPIISTRLPRFINCSKTYRNKTKYTAAICAAPKILANACLLNEIADFLNPWEDIQGNDSKHPNWGQLVESDASLIKDYLKKLILALLFHLVDTTTQKNSSIHYRQRISGG